MRKEKFGVRNESQGEGGKVRDGEERFKVRKEKLTGPGIPSLSFYYNPWCQCAQWARRQSVPALPRGSSC